nr:XRE family transcriptional regulator [uncultured Cellulosilyticum sp.]
MDYLSHNVAVNLKRIRKAKKMSLEMVAEQTGVSKSMLGQIERGESNPTISILGKIVSGLRVTFDDLVGEPSLPIFTVKKEELVPVKEEKDQYSVYCYFPYEARRNFEVYTIEIAPGKAYESGAHGEKTIEYITVVKGKLCLETEEGNVIIEAPDAVRINTDMAHIYRNATKEQLVLNVLFFWV